MVSDYTLRLYAEKLSTLTDWYDIQNVLEDFQDEVIDTDNMDEKLEDEYDRGYAVGAADLEDEVQRARDDAYDEGRDYGEFLHQNDYDNGFRDGREEGYEAGLEAGELQSNNIVTCSCAC